MNSTDMESVAKALGHDVSCFMSEDFVVDVLDEHVYQETAFYVGGVSEKQKTLASNLIEMLECADEVLSAQDDVIAAVTEW